MLHPHKVGDRLEVGGVSNAVELHSLLARALLLGTRRQRFAALQALEAEEEKETNEEEEEEEYIEGDEEEDDDEDEEEVHLCAPLPF